MARLPSAVARRAANRLGWAVDDVQDAARGMNESTALQVFADQPSRATGAVAEQGRRGLYALGAGTGVAGAGVGGAYAYGEYADLQQATEQANTRQEQVSLAQQIADDPSLPSGEKQELLDRMFDAGVLDLGIGDGGGGNGLFGTGIELPSLFSIQGLILLLVIVYAGRRFSKGGGS